MSSRYVSLCCVHVCFASLEDIAHLHPCACQDHDKLFAEYGHIGPRHPEDLQCIIRKLKPEMLDCANAREKDCLLFKAQVRGAPAQCWPDDIYTYDVFHSLGRIANRIATINKATAVCPNSSLWICGAQWRPATPPDLFSSMGYYLGDFDIHPEPSTWRWGDLVDLCGNAFDARSFLTAALICFTCAGPALEGHRGSQASA